MKEYIEIINQLADVEKKLQQQNSFQAYARNFNRMKDSLQNVGLTYQVPLHEKYSETRSDLEATITGNGNGELYITDVLKPAIYQQGQLFQKGIVIVEGK